MGQSVALRAPIVRSIIICHTVAKPQCCQRAANVQSEARSAEDSIVELREEPREEARSAEDAKEELGEELRE